MQDKVTVSLPLNICLDRPDKNGRIISQEVFEKAIKRAPLINDDGNIPVTKYDPFDDQFSLNLRNLIGYGKVNLEEKAVQIKLYNEELYHDLFSENSNIQLGIRGLGQTNENNEVEFLKITSFNVLNIKNTLPEKIIFLDVDGVLNGYNRFTGIIYRIFKKFHLSSLLYDWDIYGVHTNKVKRLKRIVDKTGAKAVLSSTWRKSWYLPYEKKDERDKELEDKLKKYGIEVVDVTPSSMNVTSSRGQEIKVFLDQHPEIKSFVIIDDEKSDIIKYFDEDKLVVTSYGGYIKGAWYENTGLKRKHIKQAIDILNKK